MITADEKTNCLLMPSFKGIMHVRVKKEYILSWGKGMVFMFGKVSPSKWIRTDHRFAMAGQSPSPCSGDCIFVLGSVSGELCPRRVWGFFPLTLLTEE